MKLYEFTPVKNTKRLSFAVGVLFCGAAAVMLVTVLMEGAPFRWIPQLVSLLMLVLGIFITTRYIMKGFVYAIIEGESGGRDLTVTEIERRSKVTVCRISLTDVEKLIVVDRTDGKTKKEIKDKIRKEKRKSFNYCANLFEERAVWIFTEECGEPLAICLSWNETLENNLRKYASILA